MEDQGLSRPAAAEARVEDQEWSRPSAEEALVEVLAVKVCVAAWPWIVVGCTEA